jgi:hypothetical protein
VHAVTPVLGGVTRGLQPRRFPDPAQWAKLGSRLRRE